MVALSALMALVGITGRPQVQNYDAVFDFPYPGHVFSGEIAVDNLHMAQTSCVGCQYNLSLDPANDSSGFLWVSAPPSTPMTVTNASGTWTINGSQLTSSTQPGLDYLIVSNAARWMNVSQALEIDVIRSHTGGFFYNIRSSPQSQSLWTGLNVRYTPSVGASWARISVVNASILLSNGTTVPFAGKDLVSVSSFSSVYVSFYTKEHTFPLWIGEDLTWSGGSVSLKGVDGVVYPQQGDQRPCSNATVTSLASPRFSTMGLAYNFTLGEVQARLHTETTTLQVVDSNGSTVVGASSQDLVTFPGAPDKNEKAALLVVLTVALAVTPFVVARRREEPATDGRPPPKPPMEESVRGPPMPAPPEGIGPESETDGRTAELLQEAGETMRFEGEMLWRALEFFIGFSATLLAIAFGILQVGISSTVRGSAALFVAEVAGLFALLGQLVLSFQSFDYLRARLVRDRLIAAVARRTTPPQLDYEAAALTATMAHLERLNQDDLRSIAEELLGRGGIRWVFRIAFGLLIIGSLVSMLIMLPLEEPDLGQVLNWAVASGLLILAGAWGTIWGFSIPWGLRRAANRSDRPREGC